MDTLSFDPWSMQPSGNDRSPRGFLAVEVLPGGEERGYVLVNPYEIQMAFKLPALERKVVDAPRLSSFRLRAKPVYVLTKDGLYRTAYGSIASFLEGLPPFFFEANASLVVNLLRVRSFELMQTKQKSLVFLGRDGRRYGDRAILSRRAATRLRSLLRIRRPDDDREGEGGSDSIEPEAPTEPAE
jgi:hypothetical protein